MKEYQERVCEEKTALDEKLDALSAFLNKDDSPEVSSEELARLERQQAIMANYSAVLDERISAFN